jgi:MFS transporter, UMF1 family
MLARLNPFARLPNGRAVWAWGMYDLANQSFQLLINTLLFSVFVQQVVVVGNPDRGKALWGGMVAGSLLLVALLSPALGAIADHKAWKREMLLATGVVCAVFTAALAIVAPGQVYLAIVLYGVAAVACGLGENFLGSFLPEISTPKNVGFVSALGWTMSYVGAVILLAITAVYAYMFGREAPEQARPIFVFSGIWFAAGIVPAFVFLRERARPRPGASATVVGEAFRRLAASARRAGDFRDLGRFFIAFLIYSMGTQTMVFFLGIIAGELGFGLADSLSLALVIALTAGVSSALVARFQDAFGHRRTVLTFLLIWIAATLGIAGAQAVSIPEPGYFVVAGLIGLGLGGIGTASRAVVGAFTPEGRSGEFFGLWGMIYKLSGIAGAIAFATVSAAVGMVWGLLLVAAFFGAGLVLLLRVNEARGIQAAQRAETQGAA